MQTIAQFIQTTGLTMKVAPREDNPNMTADAKWAAEASHWTCTIHFGRQRMTIPFSQGAAHTKPPELTEVLDCLASDAAGYDNARSFEEWASEYGYDTDSRKAEKTYKAVKAQSVKLRALLGEHYETLLFDTERL